MKTKVVERIEKTWELAIPPSSEKILFFLAMKGGQSRYEIAKRAKISYPRVHENIRSLEDFGLIKGKIEGKAEKTGQPLKKYALTLWGLTNVLKLRERKTEFENLPKGMDQIATNNRELLPLIFGKWSYFNKFGVKDELVYGLHSAALDISSRGFQVFGAPTPLTRRMAKEYFRKIEPETKLAESLTGETLVRLLLTKEIAYHFTEGIKGIKIFKPDRVAVKKLVLGDPEIKTFLLSYIRKNKKEIQKEIRDYDSIEKLLCRKLALPKGKGKEKEVKI